MVSGDISPEFCSPCDMGCAEVGAAPLINAAWCFPVSDFVEGPPAILISDLYRDLCAMPWQT